ncbi:Formyltetrahydrofolate deformylase 2, mitochondrial [Glycine max]|nr:Formyltetrahydrofolate deformylase 2, mitochondrial [Glycine max]
MKMGIVQRLCSSWSNVFRLGNRNSYSSFNKSVDPTNPSCSSSSFLTHGIHVFQCPPIYRIALLLGVATFSLLIVFVFDPVMWPRMQMEEDFLRISKTFNAMRSVIRVPALDPKYKIAILVAKQDHCLIDLLHGWQDGRLSVDITCVISNHYRSPENEVIRFLDMHGVPYHYLRTTAENKREEEILELVQNTDFLVLARSMRILSSFFLRSYGKDIINIHHGLLPSFSGSNPSKQAVDAGVKLIGATSHFVTEGLDAGPIIEQMVERVSHRDNLQSYVQKSENLEKQCLTSAIRSYCELRVLPYEKKNTVVF